MGQRLYFVAAEPSGDLLAREVIDEIRKQDSEIRIAGIGGAEMAAVGIKSPIDTSPLAVLGFLEGIKAYRTVVELADRAADEIVAFKPDSVILVDSWGFMLRVAQRVRERAPDIRLVKLVGPQVWATRPGRAKTLAATVDQLLCIHDIEEPFYAPFNLPVTVIGNPALSRTGRGDGRAFREQRGFPDDRHIILVLPGSRSSEVQRVAPTLLHAARQIRRARKNASVVVAPAESVRADLEAAYPGLETWATVCTPQERYDAMAAADIALACSGTVTTELAMQDTPMIVAYKTGWITWAIARGLLYRKRHITLLNIINDDQEIVPEYVQTKMTPDLISAKALQWLDDPVLLDDQREAQRTALSRMGANDISAAEVAANAILAPLPQRESMGV